MQLLNIIPLFLFLWIWNKINKCYYTPSGVMLGSWLLFISAHATIAPDYKYSFYTAMLINLLLGFFVVGEVIAKSWRKNPSKNKLLINKNNICEKILSDEKNLLRITTTLGFISLIGALQYFNIFLGHFGSLSGLLSAGWLVREEMAEGLIYVPVGVRAAALLSYTGILCALVYWIKFRWRNILILPFMGVIIMGIAQAARAGTFMIFIMIIVASIWKDNFSYSRPPLVKLVKKLLYLLLSILVIFTAGLAFREQKDSFSMDDLRYLGVFKSYAVGAISSFSVFLTNYSITDAPTMGRYSFAAFFQLVGLHQFESFGYYDEYLTISTVNDDYTNVFTIFRSAIEDFTLLGAFFYMTFLGVISRIGFDGAKKGKLEWLLFVVGIYAMFVYSPIAPMTQHNSIVISWFLAPFLLLSLKKFCSK